MAKTNRQRDKTARQIIGISLHPNTAAEVKMEAARRAIPLKKLFEEMWALYKKVPKAKGEHAG